VSRSNEVDDLHRRIEECLGWKEGESRSFSLATLRELVREKSPKLHAWATEVIRRGSHIIGDAW